MKVLSEGLGVSLMPVPSALSLWAARRPASTAYTFLRSDLTVARRLTYRELEAGAVKVAAWLRPVTDPGDRVVLLFPPGPEYVIAFLGCLRAGVAAVPLYPPRPGARVDRIAAVVANCGPALALTTSAVGAVLSDRSAKAGLESLEIHPVEPMLERKFQSVDATVTDPSGLAFIQYTSGSTGDPKGVMVSHENLLANQRAITECFGMRPDDKVLSWLPMYHDMGLIGTTLLPLVLGLETVLLNTFDFVHDPLIWPMAMARYAATCSGGPNFGYRLLAERYQPDRMSGVDLSGWRIAFNGAEPIERASMDDFAERYGRHGFDARAFYPCYGLAEATLFVTGAEPMTGYRGGRFDRRALENGHLTPADDNPGDGRTADGRTAGGSGADGRAAGGSAVVDLVSSGTAYADTELVIRGDTGEAVGDGVVGEICVRGPSVARGYWDDTEVTGRTFRTRIPGRTGMFLRTGDLGATVDGHLYVVGRLKDLIIVGGRNFYPHDVESAAVAADDRLRRGGAAAFQLDEDGQVVLVAEVGRGAVSELATDPAAVERLAAGVRRAVLAACTLKIAAVVLVRPGSLPKTSSGKTRRAETRNRFRAGGLKVVGRSAWPDGSGPGTGSGTGSGTGAGQAGTPVGQAPPGQPGTLRESATRLLAAQLGTEPKPDEFEVPLAALGLDSLKLVALKTGLERQMGRRLDSALFFGDHSLADVLNAVETVPAEVPPANATSASATSASATSGNPAPANPAPAHPAPANPASAGLRPVDPAVCRSAEEDGEGPMSQGQLQLQFHDELYPDDTANNLTCAVRFSQAIAADVLRTALAEVVRRHPALRTTMGPPGSRAQRVHAEDRFGWQVREIPETEQEEVRRFLTEVAYGRFDLSSGPLIRAAVVLAPESTTFLLVCHHAVVDYWSLRIVLADVLGEVLGLPGRAVPADNGSALAWARAEAGRSAETTAEERLAALAEKWFPYRNLVLFPAGPAGRVRRNPANVVDFEIDEQAAKALYERARRRQVTPFTVIAAAYLEALHRITGERRVIIGTPHHGRTDGRFAGTVGYLLNMIPLLVDFGAGPDATASSAADADIAATGDTAGDTGTAGAGDGPDLIERTWRELRNALALADVPFSQLVRRLAPERQGRNPLFQVTLTFQQAADGLPLADGFALPSSGCCQTLGEVELTAVDVPPRDVAFTASLYGTRNGDRLAFRLVYQRDRIGPETAKRLCDEFQDALKGFER